VTGRERSTPRNPPRRRYTIPAFRNRIVVVFIVPLFSPVAAACHIP
jgi:hypothetical protein